MLRYVKVSDLPQLEHMVVDDSMGGLFLMVNCKHYKSNIIEEMAFLVEDDNETIYLSTELKYAILCKYTNETSKEIDMVEEKYSDSERIEYFSKKIRPEYERLFNAIVEDLGDGVKIKE